MQPQHRAADVQTSILLIVVQLDVVQLSFVVDVVELNDTMCYITALLCMAKPLNCNHVTSQILSSTSCT
jgi:hypothetical protein